MKYGYNRFGKDEEGLRLNEESARRFNKWLSINNIAKNEVAHGSRAWARLIPRKQYHQTYDLNEGSHIVSMLDHAALFETVNKQRIFIAQPYWWPNTHKPEEILNYKMNDVETLAQWANNRGLTLFVSLDDSWHYPGSTILLEFKLKDTEKYIEAINTRYKRYPSY